MTEVPATAFAPATVIAYVNRSYITRQPPADIWSQRSKLSNRASQISAPSASSSKTGSNGVALIEACRAVNRNALSYRSIAVCSGSKDWGAGIATALGNFCSQYRSQASRSSKIVSVWFGQVGMRLPAGAVTSAGNHKLN